MVLQITLLTTGSHKEAQTRQLAIMTGLLVFLHQRSAAATVPSLYIAVQRPPRICGWPKTTCIIIQNVCACCVAPGCSIRLFAVIFGPDRGGAVKYRATIDLRGNGTLHATGYVRCKTSALSGFQQATGHDVQEYLADAGHKKHTCIT